MSSVTEKNTNDFVGALDTTVEEVDMMPTPADAAQELSNEPTDRGEVIAADGRTAAAWALRFIIIVAATAILLYLLKFVWMGLLPIFLALIVSTVLWPPVRWLRSKKFPAALATFAVLIGFFGIIAGIFAAMGPTVKKQGTQLYDRRARASTRSSPGSTSGSILPSLTRIRFASSFRRRPMRCAGRRRISLPASSPASARSPRSARRSCSR